MASIILWRFAEALSRDTSTIDTLKMSSLFTMASDAMDGVSAVLAVIVVSRLTSRQEEWARNQLDQQAISSPT